MHITGEPDGPPTKVGVAVVDVLTGHYAHSAILAALYARKETGKGCKIDCSLFESAVASLANIGSNWLIAGKEAQRLGSGHPSIVPYQPFNTQTTPIMLAVGNDGQFNSLCQPGVLDRPEWPLDARFATNQARVKNRTLLVSMLEEVFGTRSRDEWVGRLDGKGIPFAPINNIEQTFSHPQAVARQVVQEVEHPRSGPVKLAASAVTVDGNKPKIRSAPPFLGQHTDDVLGDILKYDEARIEQLKAEKAI